MNKVKLGRTQLEVTRTSFGVLPLQRTPFGDAVEILRKAYASGINFYDTARAYTDSEEKLGYALHTVREDVIIATKTMATTCEGVLSDIETSLQKLGTDYVDILQLHTPVSLPDPEDPKSSYCGLVKAREKGLTRFIGASNHSIDRAMAIAKSGLYDTVQFPISHISSTKDLELIDICREHNIGLIGMKPLCGGLLTWAKTAFAFLRQYDNLVPIWGIQRMEELEEIISLDSNPPEIDEKILKDIENDRKELSGNFCRACGYCLPCPADIPIPMAARMGLLLRRMPHQQFMTPEWSDKMSHIEACTECGHCKANCPYNLDTPSLLRHMLKEYREFKT